MANNINFSCLYSCTKDKTPFDPIGDYQYEIPVQTDDGWETASIASVGINEIPLFNLLNRLNELSEHRIHSLLIVKDGKLKYQQVEIARRQMDSVIVSSGLAAGDTIVTELLQGVASGMPAITRINGR